MSEILPGLYLGNVENSTIQIELGLLINCTVELPFINQLAQQYVRIPLYDPPSEESHLYTMLAYLQGDLFSIIDETLNNNKMVLIHCYVGAQRSAAVCAAYLMKKFNVSMEEACLFIRSKRPIAFGEEPDRLQINYIDALRMYESYLKSI